MVLIRFWEPRGRVKAKGGGVHGERARSGGLRCMRVFRRRDGVVSRARLWRIRDMVEVVRRDNDKLGMLGSALEN